MLAGPELSVLEGRAGAQHLVPVLPGDGDLVALLVLRGDGEDDLLALLHLLPILRQDLGDDRQVVDVHDV